MVAGADEADGDFVAGSICAEYRGRNDTRQGDAGGETF